MVHSTTNDLGIQKIVSCGPASRDIHLDALIKFLITFVIPSLFSYLLRQFRYPSSDLALSQAPAGRFRRTGELGPFE